MDNDRMIKLATKLLHQFEGVKCFRYEDNDLNKPLFEIAPNAPGDTVAAVKSVFAAEFPRDTVHFETSKHSIYSHPSNQGH